MARHAHFYLRHLHTYIQIDQGDQSGRFSPIEMSLFWTERIMKLTLLAQSLGPFCTKMGYILGEFFTNSSGHPGIDSASVSSLSSSRCKKHRDGGHACSLLNHCVIEFGTNLESSETRNGPKITEN
jgi:hypothetical protein